MKSADGQQEVVVASKANEANRALRMSGATTGLKLARIALQRASRFGEFTCVLNETPDLSIMQHRQEGEG